MDYLVKIRSVQTPLNGQFSIGANIHDIIGYFSSVFQPFWGHNALRYRRLLCMGRGQLPGIIVYYVA